MKRTSIWFESKGWTPHVFQTEAWESIMNGSSGLVNAPTGSGKTYSLLVPLAESYMRDAGGRWDDENVSGLRAIWITPIKALAKEILMSSERYFEGIGLPWRVAIRNGDTSASARTKMMRNMPQLLITTPESLHLILASKNTARLFSKLQTVVVDEWHELLGTKRGVLMELALSRLRGFRPGLQTWGISATIGNLDQAMHVLLGRQGGQLIRSKIKKRIEVKSIIPDELETMPWAGHLGIKLLEKVLPVIQQGDSTLIFTNTRSQCEIWYQRILDADPMLAGQIAMHHGSISKELRDWVEEALHDGRLRAVVCTSSLDLGVDFRPVETIVQIGGPKGVARFAQRAGRSGHQPGALSRIYFVPTHALELAEAAALREALANNNMESRQPFIRSFDVLVQYLTTLAVGDGFVEEEVYEQVLETHCFASMSEAEWKWCLAFICSGGDSLKGYDEFHKVEVVDGLYRVMSRRIAMRHRMQIGAIVSDAMLTVKIKRGKRLGSIEESFVSKLKPGDAFRFGGLTLELVRIKDMVVQVVKSNSKTAKVPAWQGGRLPLSNNLGDELRKKWDEVDTTDDEEMKALRPLVKVQKERSMVPSNRHLLIECFDTKQGHHLLMYPFEGRFVHEGLAALLAYRMSLINPISFSIAFNDYGFELLSDQPIDPNWIIDNDLLTTTDLYEDVQNSVNASQMANRRFRDIAGISGLVFKGYPGNHKKDRHLQASSQLFFEVFRDYDPMNLLYRQSFDEGLEWQLEFDRMYKALDRLSKLEISLMWPDKPTPFAFPIMVDRLRENFVAESFEDRIKKMQLSYR